MAAAHSSPRDDAVTKIIMGSLRRATTDTPPRAREMQVSYERTAARLLSDRAVLLQFAIERGFADAELLGCFQLVPVQRRNRVKMACFSSSASDEMPGVSKLTATTGSCA